MNETLKVLLTDHPWPETDIERTILAAAGLELTEPRHRGNMQELVALAHGAAAILTCWAPVPAEMIADNAGLRLVARLGVGVDNIDLASARANGVLVTNVPDYCVEEVSDHVLALVHAWARGIVSYDRDVHAGRWEPAARVLRRVSSLKVGVVGLGRIGSRVAEKFQALGAAVVGSDPHGRARSGHVQIVAQNHLLEAVDVVTVHVPLNKATHHLVDHDFLSQMCDGSLLVNTSRGPVIDTQSLLDALALGRPGAAALDVVEGEPAVPAELLKRSNVILTPHVSFSSDRSIAELRTRASEEVVRVLSGGRPLHGVPAN